MFAKIIIDWPEGDLLRLDSAAQLFALNIGETSLQLHRIQAEEVAGESLNRKDLINTLKHMVDTDEKTSFYCTKTNIYLHFEPKNTCIAATGSKECNFLEMMSNVVQIAQNFLIYEFEAQKDD